jgi:hypothetical protein
MGQIAHWQGDYAKTWQCFTEGMALAREMDNRWTLRKTWKVWPPWLAAREGWSVPCALFGAADALRSNLGAPLAPIDRAEQETHLAALRQSLGEETFAAAWRQDAR